MTLETIGKIIHDERIRQGLSCRDLSKKSGVSPSTISRIENGHRKSQTKSFFRICRALEIEVDISDEERAASEPPKIVDPNCLFQRLCNIPKELRGEDGYSVGFRNGIRYAWFLICGTETKFEIPPKTREENENG